MTQEDARTARPYRMTARAEAAEATAEAVLDVALRLFTDRAYDDVSLEDVAADAGVTKRTVLRRFGSKDDLFVAAMTRAGEEMLRQRFGAPVGDIQGAAANVLEHYERWGRNRLRMLSQEERIPVVAEDVEIGRRVHRSWVEQMFAPLLEGYRGAERGRRLVTLILITDVYTWKLLRLDLGLSLEETNRILVDMIQRLRGGR